MAEGVTAPKVAEFVESKADLVAYIEGGNKPIEDWRIGTEHEKFG
jgi:glutamate--cysteine ligase